jgi:RNA-directed DNA polymerase
VAGGPSRSSCRGWPQTPRGPPVRAVEITKKSGGSRMLGVPTVADRVAQTVAYLCLEPEVEPVFHPDSHGYRPGRSAHDALAGAGSDVGNMTGLWIWISSRSSTRSIMRSCSQRSLITPTSGGSFSTCNGGSRRRCNWRTAPSSRGIAAARKVLRSRPCWPIYSSITRSMWLVREFPDIPFERYADDEILYCETQQQAQVVLDAIIERLATVGLELNLDKTRMVYCKDANRSGSHEHEQFTFLGYTFRPRVALGRGGETFVSFSPAISNDAAKKTGQRSGAGGCTYAAQKPSTGSPNRSIRPCVAGSTAASTGQS